MAGGLIAPVAEARIIARMQAPIVGSIAIVVFSGTPEGGELAYHTEEGEAIDFFEESSREGRKTVGIGGTFLIIFN